MSKYTVKFFGSGPEIAGLIVFIVICLGVSALGGLVTATSVGGWYQGLEKPPFNPPDWVFAPVWTTLYVLMAIAAWRVWRRAGFERGAGALAVFAVQLALNLAWSFVFFGLQRIDLALVEIVILLVAIIATAAMFWRIDRLAGMLLVPYALWVAFATALNASLWQLN
ncbi:MAG: tryptophan-rich sensory protein [Gammaproteobacteria bacterium]|nr:tryptophan-rich sensory protein [Gammaproteobacteria bacterium]NIM72556.1 tryptophan-rich sensory protein [Gammaproteobacteria bacterium]NIN37588.1 tryptophan-rich sensory protein [Gammaproteobacteria bacterium]NIO24315.1 tryptophan-rich sensory protein [Gammaproteobacteria bacterium]NIO64920.1 tryptophan-rich sensory protein [Gammaproteobacteria bacterium]